MGFGNHPFASTGWLLCACHYQKLLWDKSGNPSPFLSVPVFPLEPTFRVLQRSAIERHHGSQRNFAELSLGNSEHTANLGVMATVRSGGAGRCLVTISTSAKA